MDSQLESQVDFLGASKPHFHGSNSSAGNRPVHRIDHGYGIRKNRWPGGFYVRTWTLFLVFLTKILAQYFLANGPQTLILRIFVDDFMV